MGKQRSFKDLLQTQCYDDFFWAIRRFLSSTSQSANLRNDYQYVKLDDIDVQFVIVSNLPETAIAFDVVVDATLIGVNHSRNYGEEDDYENQWFKLSCTANLDNGLKNVYIGNIEIYNRRQVNDNPMSDSLVPIFYKHQLDDEANKLLKEFYPEALLKPCAVDIRVLTDKMGLVVKPAHLSSGCSIFGMTLFTDGVAKTYRPETNTYEDVEVKAGTILYDPEVYFMRSLGSVRNTIAHECVHWHFHKKAMELERIFNADANKIRCQVNEITPEDFRESKTRNPLEWMEWQANAMAPRILMPREMFIQKAELEFQSMMEQRCTSKRSDVIEEVIQELAAFFEVSRLAAKIRLIDVGYEEAKGAFHYYRDRYLPCYRFLEGAIENNQTFHCSLIDVSYAYAISSMGDGQLKSLFDSRKLVYVDFCVCIYDEKYVTKSETGKLSLTPYAFDHMDECCLKFDIQYKRTASFDSTAYSDYVLFKKIVESLLPDISFSAAKNGRILERADANKLLAERAVKISRLVQRLPNAFSESFRLVMDECNITDEALAKSAGCEPRTISRYKNDENAVKTKKLVLAMCVGMRLPTVIVEDLMRKAQCPLGLSHEDILIRTLLNTGDFVDLNDWEEKLKALIAEVPSKK